MKQNKELINEDYMNWVQNFLKDKPGFSSDFYQFNNENAKNDPELDLLVTRNLGEIDAITSDVLIYAPQINESFSYNYEIYKGEIRKYIDKYVTVPDLIYSVIIKDLKE